MANERVIKEIVITPQLSVGDRQAGESVSSDIEIVKASGGASVSVITGPSETSTVNFNDGTSDVGQLEFDQSTQEFALMINSNSVITTNATTTTVLGNLTVEGTTTTVDSTEVEIADRIFRLNKDEPGPGVTLITAGIEIERGPSDDNAGWFFNEAQNWWGPAGPSGSLETDVGVTNTLGNINTIDTTTGLTPDILTITGTGAITIPSGTTGERPFPTSDGMIRFNTDTDELEFFHGTIWDQFVTGGSGVFLDKTGDTMTGNLTMDSGTEINFGGLFLNEGDGNVNVAPDIRMDANGLITAGGSIYLGFDDDNSGTGGIEIRRGGQTTGSSTIVARFIATSPTDSELNMTGNPIANVADPTAGDEVGDRDYNDNRYIEVAGDTMTGDLILNADPTVALGAATKQYVDNSTPDVVDDTTPQLGGNLDVNGHSIVSVSNGNIPITPNGIGRVVLAGSAWPAGLGLSGQVLRTNGSGSLSFNAIDVNQLANGTDGQIITWNSSGVATTVGPGTSGQVLASNGAGSAPSFQSFSANARGNNLWGFNISSTDEVTGLSSSLSLIRIAMLNVVVSTTGAELYLELGTSGGYSTTGIGINFLGANGSQSVDEWTAGVATVMGTTFSTGVINGIITLWKVDFSGNDEWFIDWKLTSTIGGHINTGSGYIQMGGGLDLDRARLTLSVGSFSGGAWYGYGS